MGQKVKNTKSQVQIFKKSVFLLFFGQDNVVKFFSSLGQKGRTNCERICLKIVVFHNYRYGRRRGFWKKMNETNYEFVTCRGVFEHKKKQNFAFFSKIAMKKKSFTEIYGQLYI